MEFTITRCGDGRFKDDFVKEFMEVLSVGGQTDPIWSALRGKEPKGVHQPQSPQFPLIWSTYLSGALTNYKQALMISCVPMGGAKV